MSATVQRVKISAIIPARNESVLLKNLLARLVAEECDEIVIGTVDGDETVRNATAGFDCRIASISTPSRGKQLNAAARIASGDLFLFLHADSMISPGTIAALKTAVTHGAKAGYFPLIISHESVWARIISLGANLRADILGFPYGDQGCFVTRIVFDSVGGFPDIPIMEDLEFIRKVGKNVSLLKIPKPVSTSPRRWLIDGWLNRSSRNMMMVALYLLGAKPEYLKQFYR